MKFTILRNELVAALATVMGVVERAQTLQILSHVLIEATDDAMTITGTNLEVELRAGVVAEIERPGKSTVHARKLYDIARNLPEGSELKIEFSDDRATLKSGRSRYSLPVLPAIEMPMVDERPLQQGVSFRIPERELKRLMQRVSFVVASNDPRPQLNGMLLHIQGGQIRAIGSDGVTLGFTRAALVDCAEDANVQVILHGRSVKEIIRLLSDTDEPAHIQLSPWMTQMELASCRVTTKAIDTAYFAYERVMEVSPQWSLRVDRDALRSALIRSSIVMPSVKKPVVMTLHGGAMEIAAQNATTVEAGDEHLDAEFDGADGFRIGFSADVLGDVIAALPPGQILMRVGSAMKQAHIRAADNDDCQYVVAPFLL
jgi:DNA polymerase-3 subunit beta